MMRRTMLEMLTTPRFLAVLCLAALLWPLPVAQAQKAVGPSAKTGDEASNQQGQAQRDFRAQVQKDREKHLEILQTLANLQDDTLPNNEGVQKELKLTEDQIAKIKDVTKEVRHKYPEGFQKLSNFQGEERQKKSREVQKAFAEEFHKGLGDCLKPEQAKRLKQIALQQRGIDALTDAEVDKTLKLTDEQKDKIKTIQEDMRMEMMREIPQGDVNGAQTLRKEALDKAVAAVADEQKAAWKDLTGEPFQVKFQLSRGRR
jgi:hypothetical protein